MLCARSQWQMLTALLHFAIAFGVDVRTKASFKECRVAKLHLISRILDFERVLHNVSCSFHRIRNNDDHRAISSRLHYVHRKTKGALRAIRPSGRFGRYG